MVPVVAGLAAFLGMALPAAILLGWCAGAALWLALAVPDMLGVSSEEARRRAERQDEGKWIVLAGSVAAAVASLFGVAWNLLAVAGSPQPFAVGLSLFTLLLSWNFVHVLFATHYAHEYWIDGKGIEFQGEPGKQTEPDFMEFLYFSYTIGMTFQVSDATTNEPSMRRLVLLHAIVAFIFNTVIVAATVNLVAQLAG